MAVLSFRHFTVIADGTYRFALEDVQEQDKGKFGPSLQWKCKVIDESDQKDNTLNYLTSQTFGPTSKTYKFLKVLGLQEDLAEDIDFDSADFVGQQFFGKVETKKADEGKEYANLVTIWSVEEFEKMLSAATSKGGSNKGTPGTVVKGKPSIKGKEEVADTPSPVKIGKQSVSKEKEPGAQEEGDLQFPSAKK